MDELIRALTATNLPFAHFAWATAPAGDYGVYAEDDDAVMFADNAHAETATNGTIDYFTRADGGAAKRTIESALDTVPGCAWRHYSTQFEEDSGYIHYEWTFSVL